MSDLTYNVAVIKENPTWHVAWVLSETLNDNAPIGWSKYISAAESLMSEFTMTPRESHTPPPLLAGDARPDPRGD